MLNFIIFLCFGIAVFLLSLIGYKKYRSTTLYALAIGGVVNANFFHAGAYPVVCFGLPFGIDSLIYTLFAFCVIIMLLKGDKKQAYLLAFSSIIAILFSACMQLAAELMSEGSSLDVWQTFFTFLISSVASVIAVIISVETVSRIKDKYNVYVCVILGVMLISLLNSAIYYPLAVIINNSPQNVLLYVGSSYLGKIIALGCCVLTTFLIQVREKK